MSAIYGPNGGGKSNVLAALHTLVAKVLRPLFATEDNEEKVSFQKRIIVEPFAFSENKNEPTEFELFFRTTVSEYRYILHVSVIWFYMKVWIESDLRQEENLLFLSEMKMALL